MRRSIQLGLVATAMVAMTAGTALAGPLETTLSSNGQTISGLTFYVGAGTTGYSTSNFMGWAFTTKLTNSGSSPALTSFGVNLSNTYASCQNTSGCAPLTVAFSGVGFTSSVADFGTSLTNAQTGTGKVVQQAYYDPSNTYFGMSNTIVGSAFGLNGSGTTSMIGGGPVDGAVSPYSLTLVDTFSDACTSTSCATFQIGTDVVGNVPEPGTLALFGAGLLGLALFLRRRHHAGQRFDR